MQERLAVRRIPGSNTGPGSGNTHSQRSRRNSDLNLATPGEESHRRLRAASGANAMMGHGSRATSHGARLESAHSSGGIAAGRRDRRFRLSALLHVETLLGMAPAAAELIECHK
jgi:hypothetical protein